MQNFGIKYNNQIIRVFRYEKTAIRYQNNMDISVLIVPTNEELTEFPEGSPYYEGDINSSEDIF
jgi:acetate kinase